MMIDMHIAALCAAIDAGEDGALPILADWLEEQTGAPTAAILRHRPYAADTAGGKRWVWENAWPHRPGDWPTSPYHLPNAVFRRLSVDATFGAMGRGRAYHTLAAAYLDLALALTGDRA